MLASLDVETKGRNARAFLIGTLTRSDRKKPKWFYTPDDMYNGVVELILKEQDRGHNTFIYAHNHSFDHYSYAQNHLKDTANYREITPKPLFGILHKTGYLLDTMSFFKAPLAEVGDLINLPKLKTPPEVLDQNKKWTQFEIDLLKPYCYRDAEIVLKSIIQLKKSLSTIGHTPKHLKTAGKLAMTYFQTWCKNQTYNNSTYSAYLWRKGTIHQTNYHEFIRKAYRGGRNEAYQTGKHKNITKVDINAMFPHAMTQIPMPDLLKEYKPTKLNMQLLDGIGVIKATVTTPNQSDKLPFLPMRYGRCQLYPYKETIITGYWTTLELKKALEEGYTINTLHNAVMYKPLPFNPFINYQKKLYEKRLQYKKAGNHIMSHTIKLLMNSLYGKFGQYRSNQERIITHRKHSQQMVNQRYQPTADYGEECLYTKNTERLLPRFAHPIICILTTAQARIRIYNEMSKIPFKDLLYCDTDGFSFKGNHLDAFKISDEMGDFKIEEQSPEAWIQKEKWYSIGNKIKSAGVNPKTITQKQLTGQEEILTHRMYTRKMALKTGHFEKVGTFYPVKLTIGKKIKREIKHASKVVEL